jgi:hypothetical protein
MRYFPLEWGLLLGAEFRTSAKVQKGAVSRTLRVNPAAFLTPPPPPFFFHATNHHQVPTLNTPPFLQPSPLLSLVTCRSRQHALLLCRYV